MQNCGDNILLSYDRTSSKRILGEKEKEQFSVTFPYLSLSRYEMKEKKILNNDER